MRVAIDARKLTRIESGIGIYTLNLVRGLLREDSDLELLLVRHGSGGRSDFDSARVEDVIVPFTSDSPLTPLALARFLRGHRFDLFHSPFDLSPRGLRRPLVVTVHDLSWFDDARYSDPRAIPRFFRGLYYRAGLRASLDRADRLIAISNATRDAIAQHAPRDAAKVRVIRNAYDAGRLPPLSPPEARRVLERIPNLPPEAPFVLTVGQGLPYKNHLGAVAGFLAAFEDRPEYRLVLVRRDAEADPRLSALLRSTAARQRVIVLPHVDPPVLNALYRRARIVLHPSVYEGFGLPLIEAMAAGTPVVTSAVGAMAEVAGPAALLVDPNDPDAIGAALRRVEDDGALRERLIAEGRQRLALFDAGASARAALAVYREAVEARAAASGRSGSAP